MSFDKVRTRFAPSPTGYMHVGNLRTALYAYLTAKAQDGIFILRIEDTDQERYVEGAVDIIYNTLRETGLLWDEGPDVGGPVGPYVQSERMGMFKDYALQLVEKGAAYYCFCDKDRLEEVRAVQQASGIAPKYDGHCRHLTPEEVQEKLAAGIPYVIRQKVPTEGTVTFHDQIFGDITVDCADLDDQVLIKADGMPTYNFANVVDDHTMGITHVIRGNEYLSSTPKYNLLYEAFGWEVPVYIHCPPVMKDATHKLSKRNGDASYEDLIAKGYLKDAVLNYIALLGWSPKGEREIFTLPELVGEWDPAGISKSPAIFDGQKLRYINGEYIRALSPEQFYERALPWMRQTVKSETADLRALAGVLQARCEVLSDIPEQVDFIDTVPEYDLALYTNKKMKTTPETSLAALRETLPVLEGLADFTAEAIHTALFERIAQLEVKNGWLLFPLRVAVSGKQFTPGGGIELCAILGKEESIRRVKPPSKSWRADGRSYNLYRKNPRLHRGFFCWIGRLFGGPAGGALHRFAPTGQQLCAGLLLHLRLVKAVQGPLGADILQVLPDAGGQARQIGRSQGGGLPNHGAADGAAHNVRLELHQEVVGGGAAVHPQLPELFAGVLLHSRQHVTGLVGDGFQGRPDDVVPSASAGQPQDGPPGVHVPVGSAQAGEGGDDVHAAAILDTGGEVFAIAAVGNKVHLVPEPLDYRPAHKDAALQAVLHLAVPPHSDGG